MAERYATISIEGSSLGIEGRDSNNNGEDSNNKREDSNNNGWNHHATHSYEMVDQNKSEKTAFQVRERALTKAERKKSMTCGRDRKVMQI